MAFSLPSDEFLLSHYTLDDASGTDELSNYPAMLLGEWNTVPGTIGNAQRAVDWGDEFRIPNLGDWFTGRTDFTISFHMRYPPNAAGTYYQFMIGNETHNAPYYLLGFQCQDYMDWTINNISVNLPGDWPVSDPLKQDRHHIVLTAKAGIVYSYVDEVLQGQLAIPTGALATAHPDASLGRIPAINSTTNASAVDVDDLRIYTTGFEVGEVPEVPPTEGTRSIWVGDNISPNQATNMATGTELVTVVDDKLIGTIGTAIGNLAWWEVTI